MLFHTCDSCGREREKKQTSYLKRWPVCWHFVSLPSLLMMKRTRFFHHIHWAHPHTQKHSRSRQLFQLHTHHHTHARMHTFIIYCTMYAHSNGATLTNWRRFFFFISIGISNWEMRTLYMNKCHPLKYKHIQSASIAPAVFLHFFFVHCFLVSFFYLRLLHFEPLINKNKKWLNKR